MFSFPGALTYPTWFLGIQTEPWQEISVDSCNRDSQTRKEKLDFGFLKTPSNQIAGTANPDNPDMWVPRASPGREQGRWWLLSNLKSMQSLCYDDAQDSNHLRTQGYDQFIFYQTHRTMLGSYEDWRWIVDSTTMFGKREGWIVD